MLIVRLNKLEYAKIMLEKKIRFSGWCTLSNKNQKVDITPILQEKLLKEDKPYKEKATNKFTNETIASNVKINPKFNLNLIKTNRDINDYDKNLNGSMLLFEGEIETDYYDNELFIQIQTDQNIAFSNKLSIEFDKKEKTHAYFLAQVALG